MTPRTGYAIAIVVALAASNIAAAADLDYAALVAKAKAAIAHDLKDPDSAKFRNLRVTRTANPETHQPYPDGAINPDTHRPFGVNVCGEVNAKNSYGGYTGFRRFYFDAGDDGTDVVLIEGEGDLAKILLPTLIANGQCNFVIKKF